MKVSDLFLYKKPEIKALHLTWIAFYICFCLVQYGATSHQYAEKRGLADQR